MLTDTCSVAIRTIPEMKFHFCKKRAQGISHLENVFSQTSFMRVSVRDMQLLKRLFVLLLQISLNARTTEAITTATVEFNKERLIPEVDFAENRKLTPQCSNNGRRQEGSRLLRRGRLSGRRQGGADSGRVFDRRRSQYEGNV